MISSFAKKFTDSDWLKENADVIDQGLLFASNTVILASEIFKSIPKSVPSGARTLCSFYGVISLHFEFRDFWKLDKDLELAVKHFEWNNIIYTTAKVALKALDIFLTIGSFTVTSLSFAGHSEYAANYYRKTIPLATASWFLLIAFDLIDYYRNKALLKEMESLEESQKTSLCKSFQGDKSNRLARDLHRQFDNYRLDDLKKKGITFEKLLENLKASTNLNKADIALKAFGYVCLGINKRYPETAIQAFTTWSVSAFYTSKRIYSKYYATS